MTRTIIRTVSLVIVTLLVAGVWSARPPQTLVFGGVAEAKRTGDAAGTLTLADCYALALKQSEKIAIQRELLVEAEGRFQQARSGLLPRLSFGYTYRRQDTADGGSVRGLFAPEDSQESKVAFSQPLFAGFKEFAAMAAARAERRSYAYEKTRAEQLLFADVADAFYLVLSQEDELGTLETIHRTLLDRIKELVQRERLGRSRRSEVASAEAQLYRVEAELEQARAQETTARQLLEFLTGSSPLGSLVEDEPTLPLLASEEAYHARAGDRPDVGAAREAWVMAQEAVRVVRSRAWPSVELQGNYYFQRPSTFSGVDWDAALKVDIPLFQGGQTTGAVKESAARARQAEERLAQTERTAAREIREAFTRAQTALVRAGSLEQARKAAEESYRMQEQEYRRSLVNNLDVLQALRELADVRRDASGARQEAKRQYWRLQVASGAVP